MMPPRREGVELVPIDEPGVTVGKCIIPGVGVRIGVMQNGALVHMSPAGARRMAAHFETAQCVAAGIAWIAQALRESADEVEAAQAVKQ
jgi:hypothetical protein